MAVKVGDRVYIKAHAYFHWLGEVTEILGPRRVALKNASKIHHCARSWEEFFRDGCAADTTYDYCGNVPDTGYIDAVEWLHDLPLPKEKKRGRA